MRPSLTKEGASPPSLRPTPTSPKRIDLVSNCRVIPAGDEGITGGALPADFALEQNYPNPNPRRRYDFPSANSFVGLKVYNQLGQELTWWPNRWRRGDTRGMGRVRVSERIYLTACSRPARETRMFVLVR
jgi:hypothetical protein